jgi:hypothetical protein
MAEEMISLAFTLKELGLLWDALSHKDPHSGAHLIGRALSS